MTAFEGTILKVNAQGQFVLSSTLDEDAGEKRAPDDVRERTGQFSTIEPTMPRNVRVDNADPTDAVDPYYIKITWDLPTDLTSITGYEVRAETNGIVKTANGSSATTATISGLNAFVGNQFRFQVRAMYPHGGRGNYSPWSPRITPHDPQGADIPTNVQVADNASGVPDFMPDFSDRPLLRVSWTEPEDTTGVTGYMVKTVPDGFSMEVGLQGQWTIFYGFYEDTYHFAVQALRGDSTSHSAFSEPSVQSSATDPEYELPDNVPLNVHAVGEGSVDPPGPRNVQITWDPPPNTDDIDHYEVFSLPDTGGSAQVPADTFVCNFWDWELPAGPWRYVVRAAYADFSSSAFSYPSESVTPSEA